VAGMAIAAASFALDHIPPCWDIGAHRFAQSGPLRILVATQPGKTRPIDNVAT
jgi:hypothetical protein